MASACHVRSADLIPWKSCVCGARSLSATNRAIPSVSTSSAPTFSSTAETASHASARDSSGTGGSTTSCTPTMFSGFSTPAGSKSTKRVRKPLTTPPMDARAPRIFSFPSSVPSVPPVSASSSSLAGARRNSASTAVATSISSGDGRRHLNGVGIKSVRSPSRTLDATHLAGKLVEASPSSAAKRSSTYVPVSAPHIMEARCAAISASRSDLPVTLSSNMDRRTADTSDAMSTIRGPPL